MITSDNPRIRWWQRGIDSPITLTFACCTALAFLLATFALLIDGVQLVALFVPMGLLAGADLSLRLSRDASMRKWSRFVDRILARLAKVVFVYGLPIWVCVAAKCGVGFTVVVLGGVSALLLFVIGGTTALTVAVLHVIRSSRR
jgi:hypothetical protein